MNVWKTWAKNKGLNDDIVKYEAKELDEYFSRFFAEIRRSNGCTIYDKGGITKQAILGGGDKLTKQIAVWESCTCEYKMPQKFCVIF